MLAAPHLVLDGITLAARAVNAERAYLCVHDDAHEVDSALTRAIAERRGTRFEEVEISLVRVPHRYVASEETALVQLINGGPALPAFTPPRPFERGVGARPTLVDNVETLAHLALIARYGPVWFRSQGTAKAPGTTLVTLGGAVRSPGVHEVPLGISGAQLLALAGGAREPIQAVLCGGYFGSWLPAQSFERTEISAPGLAAAGSAIGAGIFLALPERACGLVETAGIARYLAGQSAGQCGPCVHGLPALADALEMLAVQGGAQAAHTVQSLMPYVERRGACRHPDGAVRLIASALRVFAADARAHGSRRPCAASRGGSRLSDEPQRASGNSSGRRYGA